MTTAPYKHTRVITVAEPVANVMKTIKVVITPTDTKLKPDTVIFTRTKIADVEGSVHRLPAGVTQ